MSYPKQLSEYRRTFLGECLGIGLSNRGPDDNHVMITIRCEDDANWSASSGSFSSFWLPDLQEQLKEALAWLKKNTIKEEYGWRFK